MRDFLFGVTEVKSIFLYQDFEWGNSAVTRSSDKLIFSRLRWVMRIHFTHATKASFVIVFVFTYIHSEVYTAVYLTYLYFITILALLKALKCQTDSILFFTSNISTMELSRLLELLSEDVVPNDMEILTSSWLFTNLGM